MPKLRKFQPAHRSGGINTANYWYRKETVTVAKVSAIATVTEAETSFGRKNSERI